MLRDEDCRCAIERQSVCRPLSAGSSWRAECRREVFSPDAFGGLYAFPTDGRLFGKSGIIMSQWQRPSVHGFHDAALDVRVMGS